MVWLHQYHVIGRKWPDKKNPVPDLLFMKIFSPNKIIAKSRFWYFLKKTQKLKNSKGEIISIEEIFEKNNKKIKNYGIWLRYESKSGVNNMFKEYRDVTINSAVEQMYFELAGRQRARWNSIIILRVEELTAKECIRPQVKQFHNSRIKFPFTHSVQRDDIVHPLNFYKATRPRTSIKI
mmetsp:Transcript_65925/g.137297  ORF Transcript_65925/g.137297 Transcript_65925/m.137297 type:complete len:179 (-) Transcript_65925:352-888(-)